jgi:hypothetical protein
MFPLKIWKSFRYIYINMYIYLFNALKLTHGNIEFQKFSRNLLGPPPQEEGRGGKEEGVETNGKVACS